MLRLRTFDCQDALLEAFGKRRCTETPSSGQQCNAPRQHGGHERGGGAAGANEVAAIAGVRGRVSTLLLKSPTRAIEVIFTVIQWLTSKMDW